MKSPTPTAQAVALATIGIVTDGKFEVPDPIPVHFNPVSLQLQISNTNSGQKSSAGKAAQNNAETTTKLTMDLVFDSTDTGEDVAITTSKLRAFVAPPAPAGKQTTEKPALPLLLFEWGTLRFRGVADSYKETIDFFSANGVPLRSSLNLTLSRQDGIFDPASDKAPKDAGTVADDLFDTPTANASDVANAAGAPSAARSLAAANGQESLRFGAGAGLTVGGSVELKPPVAFASAGVGAGISLGGGAGIGFGASAGAGLSLGVSAGVGVSAGGSASVGIAGLARLSASEGAFAGLRVTNNSSTSFRIDASRLAPKIASTTVATDAGATFKIGGKASIQGAAGLRADVGASGKLSFDTN